MGRTIDVTICQVRISEIPSNLPADLIVPTSRVKRDFGVLVISGIGFVGIGLIVDMMNNNVGFSSVALHMITYREAVKQHVMNRILLCDRIVF